MPPRTAHRQRQVARRRRPSRALVLTMLAVALVVLTAALVALSSARDGSGPPPFHLPAARTGYYPKAAPGDEAARRSYSAVSLRQGQAGPPGSDPVSRWRPILAAIDGRRARAWRTGNPALLRRVYVAGSHALRRDRAMLSRYGDRGLRVDGVRLGFLSVAVLAQRPGRADLLVVDQLGRARALGPHGARLVLPTDRPSRHRVTLRRTSAGWRIAAVSNW